MSELGESVVCATSKRLHGNMDFRFGEPKQVIANRTRFLEEHGIRYQQHIAMRCDHGEIITLVDATHSAVGACTQGDQVHSEVLITQAKDLALMLLTADCQSTSFYDPVTQTIALAHISRQTLTQGLTQQTLAFLGEEFGIKPEDLRVHIGPAIHKESYAFALPLQHVAEPLVGFIEERDGCAYIDLISAHQHILFSSGIRPENLTTSPEDTGDGREYFSHHHSVRTNENDEARMATILMMH